MINITWSCSQNFVYFNFTPSFCGKKKRLNIFGLQSTAFLFDTFRLSGGLSANFFFGRKPKFWQVEIERQDTSVRFRDLLTDDYVKADICRLLSCPKLNVVPMEVVRVVSLLEQLFLK